jgi:acyl-CoA thioester hydrolase
MLNEISKNEGYEVALVREVLFRDLDAMGHMNNVTSIYYMEDARVEYFKQLGQAGLQAGVETVLARVECDYVTQAHMGEKLIVAIKTSLIGSKSFTFDYLISELETSRVVCRGTSISVCFHYSEGKTCIVPDAFVAELERIEKKPIPRKGEK